MPDHEKIQMPAPTISPLVLALGIVLIFSGPVLSWAMSVVGALLFIVGMAGWAGHVLSRTGTIEEEEAAPPAQVAATPGRVEMLRPGMPGHRARLPEKMHPYSAGLKGGLIGGALMPIPALIFGLIRHGSIWFPINLLAGMFLPELVNESLPLSEQEAVLSQFHPGYFIAALFMHAVISAGLGLIYGVMLPTLPGRPILWGGIVLPLLWTGFSYGFMGVLNPALHDHVQWFYFVLSQLIYGIATAIVVARSEKIPVWEVGDPKKLQIPLLLILIPLGSAGCGKPDRASQYQRPETNLNFHSLYDQNCRGCHGPDGKMGPAPPLNDPLFQAFIPDDELRQVIRHGRKGTLMPAFAGRQPDSLARLEKGPIIGSGLLTEEQIDVLIKGMRQNWRASVRTSSNHLPKPIVPHYLNAVELKEALAKADAKHGKTVFARTCARCHGEDGRKEKMAINQPAFLALVSDQFLRRIIITGRPDLKMASETMPNFREHELGELTEGDIRDVTALLASWRKQ